MKQGDIPLAKDPRDHGLTAEIIDGKVIISIGINVLAHACEFGHPDNQADEFKIVDNDEFAKDILNEITREEEDGTTPLHRLFDQATSAAIDQGSLGIEFND